MELLLKVELLPEESFPVLLELKTERLVPKVSVNFKVPDVSIAERALKNNIVVFQLEDKRLAFLVASDHEFADYFIDKEPRVDIVRNLLPPSAIIFEKCLFELLRAEKEKLVASLVMD